MAKRRKSDFDVGRGKPPRATQFKSGQSGNPKGRPKDSKNLASVIRKELKKHVVVTEDGNRKTITKEQAIIKQLVNKAASGEPRLMSMLLKAIGLDENESQPTSAQNVYGSAEDDLVMESIVQRIRQMDALPRPPAAEPDVPVPLSLQPAPKSPSTEVLP